VNVSYFAAVLARTSDRWHGVEVLLEDCESIDDVADVGREVPGDLRLVVFEQDDEYAVIVRLDDQGDQARGFLTDGRAADNYPMAAAIAEDLAEIAAGETADDEPAEADNLLDDAPLTHDSAPFGDVEIVEDLGTSASDLLAMCAREGTLPIDLLVAVCEKAGCGAVFDELRA
jgi:putative tRNA adenosine deaminase-associated protein